MIGFIDIFKKRLSIVLFIILILFIASCATTKPYHKHKRNKKKPCNCPETYKNIKKQDYFYT